MLSHDRLMFTLLHNVSNLEPRSAQRLYHEVRVDRSREREGVRERESEIDRSIDRSISRRVYRDVSIEPCLSSRAVVMVQQDEEDEDVQWNRCKW